MLPGQQSKSWPLFNVFNYNLCTVTVDEGFLQIFCRWNDTLLSFETYYTRFLYFHCFKLHLLQYGSPPPFFCCYLHIESVPSLLTDFGFLFSKGKKRLYLLLFHLPSVILFRTRGEWVTHPLSPSSSSPYLCLCWLTLLHWPGMPTIRCVNQHYLRENITIRSGNELQMGCWWWASRFWCRVVIVSTSARS